MRFGEFTVDLAAGEVHKNGHKIRLQELPFRVLAELLSRPGQVVTREELRARLWDASTFVDAEAGLNTAVAKLREALGDSADAPTFIETIPKRGYRFIASVQGPGAVQGPRSVQSPASVQGPRSPRRAPRFSGLALAVVAAIILVIAIVAATRPRVGPDQTRIAVVLFHNETGDPAMDRLAQQLTDATVIALTANPHYGVIGNAAVLRTPRIFADLKKIGDELSAEYVLVAQLQSPPTGLIVRVHFIRSSDQVHLWAKGVPGPEDSLEARVVETVRTGIATSLGR